MARSEGRDAHREGARSRDHQGRVARRRSLSHQAVLDAGAARAGETAARLTRLRFGLMSRADLKSQRLVALFLLGTLAFNYPFLALFNIGATLFGIPLLYAYIFAGWAGLIALIALTVEAPD